MSEDGFTCVPFRIFQSIDFYDMFVGWKKKNWDMSKQNISMPVYILRATYRHVVYSLVTDKQAIENILTLC